MHGGGKESGGEVLDVLTNFLPFFFLPVLQPSNIGKFLGVESC